ncbi:uncharacterized protein LOC126617101, partial [Malus sylvestris]|uniref:uncharacterized protein LOC126617101 n=1 Tax=Malus sylvestris TaxID=3752 RepID=UPI0021ABF51C
LDEIWVRLEKSPDPAHLSATPSLSSLSLISLFSPTPLDEDKDEGRQQPLPTHQLLAVSLIPKMSQLITCRRGVTNAPPAFSAPTASAMSARLIGEPTPLTEATPKVSQVPASSASSVLV